MNYELPSSGNVSQNDDVAGGNKHNLTYFIIPMGKRML